MNADELRQWEELTAKFEPDNKEAVITAIKEKAHDVFQDINDGGRAAANAANKTKLEGLQNELDTAKADLTKAQNQLKELDGKTQGAAELREKYEKDLQKAQDDFGKKETELKNQLSQERHKNAVKQLVDSLVRNHQVDREYAETIIAQRADVNDRISVDEKGRITVWKDDSKELPLVPPNDETTVVDLYAKQLSDKIEAKWKTSGTKRGPGSKGTGGEKAAEGDGDEFDEIRNEMKEKNKAGSESNRSRRGGLERLGMRR